MPITSFKQFFDFLKFSLFMPFRLGWSMIGILFFGLLLLGIMYLFAYTASEFFGPSLYEMTPSYDDPSLWYIGKIFPVLFLQAVLWQLWVSIIFVSVIVKDMGQGPILENVKRKFKKHVKAILLMVVILSWSSVLLPVALHSIEYRTIYYNAHYFMSFAIGVLFIFALIEIILNDKGLFDALAASILLLKGRYVFTFLILYILTVSLDNIYPLITDAYTWIFGDLYNNTSGQNNAENSTFYKKMAIILGGLNAITSYFKMAFYYGAVIYLYNLFSKLDAENATIPCPQKLPSS